MRTQVNNHFFILPRHKGQRLGTLKRAAAAVQACSVGVGVGACVRMSAWVWLERVRSVSNLQRDFHTTAENVKVIHTEQTEFMPPESILWVLWTRVRRNKTFSTRGKHQIVDLLTFSSIACMLAGNAAVRCAGSPAPPSLLLLLLLSPTVVVRQRGVWTFRCRRSRSRFRWLLLHRNTRAPSPSGRRPIPSAQRSLCVALAAAKASPP